MMFSRANTRRARLVLLRRAQPLAGLPGLLPGLSGRGAARTISAAAPRWAPRRPEEKRGLDTRARAAMGRGALPSSGARTASRMSTWGAPSSSYTNTDPFNSIAFFPSSSLGIHNSARAAAVAPRTAYARPFRNRSRGQACRAFAAASAAGTTGASRGEGKSPNTTQADAAGGAEPPASSPTLETPPVSLSNAITPEEAPTPPPSALDILLNDAWEATQRGDAEKAEALFRAALADQESTLGATHPDTLVSLSNLGGILLDAGKIVDAEPIIRTALERRTHVLGTEHAATLTSANNLALCLKMQNRLDEAEPLAKQAFVGTMFEFGPTHDDALDSAQNFAEILAMGGKLEESARVLQQMFEVCERAFGHKDARTLTMARNLSTVRGMINTGDG